MAKVRRRAWESGGKTKTAWVADYFDQNGKRRLKTFERKGDASAFLKKTLPEIDAGTHTPDREAVTVRDAAEIWIAACKVGRNGGDPVEPHTLRSYRNHVDLHINPLIGDLKLNRITDVAGKRFRDDLLTKLSRPMARKVLTSFKSILAEAGSAGIGAAAVMRSIKIGGGKRERDALTIPEPSQVHAIFARLDELAASSNKQQAKRWRRWRAFIVTAALTGMRASELRGLYWSAVDLDGARIAVDQRADEKGNIGNLKSKSAYRTIAIDPRLVNLLRAWKLECPPGELVFPNWQGNVEEIGNVHRAWKPVLKHCKLPPLPFHALRHYYASALHAAGASAKDMQVALGHSSIAVTLDIYTELFKTDEDQQVREMTRAATIADRLFATKLA